VVEQSRPVSAFPLPRAGEHHVAVPAPQPGAGNWAGAPSAVQDADATWVVAYRVRTTDQRGAALVVARSPDGDHLTTVTSLDRERFAAESLERPALARTPDDRWRLYVSCATPGSKHWRIDLLEADDPAALGSADPLTVLPGSALLAVKDPVVRHGPRGWEAWICCHPLDRPGEEDRMHTRYATSPDGVTWTWRGVALSGRPGAWDSRGARVTTVLPDGRAAYDGRASKEENFAERTGLAVPAGHLGAMAAQGDAPVADLRYLDAVPLASGGFRLYCEAPLADGSHELRTSLVTPHA
jgi:hypothetical protein